MGLDGSWGFPDMVPIVPVGQIGNARIRHYRQTEELAMVAKQRAMESMAIDEFKPPGVYAQLLIDNEVMMDDSPMERHTHAEALHHAKGHVLVGGLGLGMVTCGLLAKPGVEQVTVLEYSQNVISLVAPHVINFSKQFNTGLNIVKANVFEYKTDETFDMIWMDIWLRRNPDNIKEMNVLNAKFNLSENGWRGCWYEKELHAAVERTKLDLTKIAKQINIDPEEFVSIFEKDVREADKLIKSKNGFLRLGDYGRVDFVDMSNMNEMDIVNAFFSEPQLDSSAEEILEEQIEKLKEKAEKVGLVFQNSMNAI